ncbi:NADH dehydrogenase [Fervidicella metallireducens AeB]|uniref:NADH dehydrogenase n=1 Tax=Fervidicella metallireducens AeB TaxID=1403537 RepID=A0A017RVG8_9CLOT|nr:proton-conducting transporter membrane subunit [Fervidicella metallireducens]EYE88672.1 NADH dehydrogenase [Fervidicella metallireducens AeB]
MFLDFSFGIMKDFLSLFFIFIIIFISIPVLIYSGGYIGEYRKNYSVKYHWSMLILFLLSMIGVVLSSNSILFMVFWEIMSITSFFLVIYEYKNKENLKSGILYFVMTHISGLFLMFMFGFIYKYTGQTNFIKITQMYSNLETHKGIIFIFALLGFGAKAGLVPLHPWLPKAHPSAPSNISALMSGVMLKVAVYGFIRVVFVLLGGVSYKYGFILLFTGTLTALYTIINALLQNDIKKLLAYSSAENIGLIFSILGLSIILNSLKLYESSIMALTAGLFHCLNHGVFKSLLFTGAGSVLYATGTKNMNELGGLHRKIKFTSICVLIGTAAIAAIPPLNGFASESLIFMSFIKSVIAIKSKAFVLMIVICGTALALVAGGAIYSAVKAYGITYLGEARSKKAENIHRIPISMNVGMAILSLYSIILGVFSPFIINFISKYTAQYIFIKEYRLNFIGYETIFISIMFIVIITLITIVSRILDRKNKTETYETWACGFNNFKPNMQYSGDGYSQPAARYFGFVGGYKKEVIIKDTITLKQRVHDVIERQLYNPVVDFITFISGRIVKIHYGKIQIYISYIFITLIISVILVLKLV